MAKAARGYLLPWTAVRFTAEEYRVLDGERVLVLDRFRARGKASGVAAERVQPDGAHLFHVRGGVVTRLVRYQDRETALVDLGLAREERE
jgi:hypothetical protein